MKKRIFTLFLVVVMCVVMMQGTVMAAPRSTAESEPVYLGTEAEYRKTFDTMFDENGLRRVSVGYNSNDGTRYERVGLVDQYGNFVVQPIYDKILDKPEDINGSGYTTIQPSYFVGGYARAVRDGKMGLLNTKGEEVVPCKYEFVGFPSEGVCSVYQFKEKSGANNAYYLGYWSLEKNKEIVAPNKYVTPFLNQYVGDKITARGWRKPSGDNFRIHDFNGGYALVLTETGYTDREISDFRKGTIIDKNGKDILGKTYTTGLALLSTNDYQDYPQQGPYLSFIDRDVELSKYKKYEVYKAWQKHPEVKKGVVKLVASSFSGLVGPKGVLIPATYTSSSYLDLTGEGGAKLYFGFAYFQIIPNSKLVLTSNAIHPKIEYYAPAVSNRFGAIDFNNKKVIPFGESHIGYNDEYKIFVAEGEIYNSKGKKISKRKYSNITEYFYNGYNLAYTNTGKYNHEYNSDVVTSYAVKSDGTETNLSKALGLGKYEWFDEVSKFNTRGYIWLKRQGGKWGLVDFKGKKVLPFEYDSVGIGEWHNGKNGYAIVTKNGKSGIVNNAGKEMLPCSYNGFEALSGLAGEADQEKRPFVIAMEGKEGTGVINLTTGKIIIPAKYQSVKAYTIRRPEDNEHTIDVYHVKDGDKTLIMDANGQEIFATSEYLGSEPYGLYRYRDNSGYFDSQGRIIIPGELERVYNLEIGQSYTIYVKDKKVYRISANYLDINYKYKPYAPGSSSSTDTKELEVYAQSQREAHTKAFEEAVGNPYQQRAIYKQPFVALRTAPDKVTYKVGDAFETKGFKAVEVDVYGNETDVTSEITFDVNGVKIYEGYKFTTAGSKKVNCYYKGKNANGYLKITVKK